MLKIHKPFSKKLFLISITSILGVDVLLGLGCLTYTPELSHAETVVSPESKPDLSTITYMQDITQEICANTKEADASGNYQYQLIDKRDNKTYWVAKLKDGNCWMTQNLALDLNTAKPLTPVDSDILSSWTPPVTTNDIPDGFSSMSTDAVYSLNPGLYVKKDFLSSASCGVSNSINSLEECPSWINVSNISPSDDPNFSGSINSDETEYNTHYLIGNFYTWTAATAGKIAYNDVELGYVAPESICPKGWKLPTGGDNSVWSELVDGLVSTTTVVPNNMKLSPYYFVTSGYSNGGGYMSFVGFNGYYHASNIRGAGMGRYRTTYRMEVNYNDFDPSSSYYGNRAIPIRCFSAGKVSENTDNVNITIANTITLDVVNEVEVEKSGINPSTANLNVKVVSNQLYSVNINAKDHAELVSENGDSIPSNGGALTTAENNWGIMKPGDNTYTKITTTPQLFYQATSAEAKDILFKIGISTASDLTNGTYTTNLVITATQN